MDHRLELTSTSRIELTNDQQKIYERYAKTKDDLLLAALSSLDVFKFYYHAIHEEDYETAYTLHIKEDQYSYPDLDQYVKDIQDFPVTKENELKFYEKLMKVEEFKTVKVNNNEEAITFSFSEDELYHFSLTKNEKGIWKVNWLALQ